MDAAPQNFRLTVFQDDEEVHTNLWQFLAENEGAPDVCHLVSRLEPGKEVGFSSGLRVLRPESSPPRYAHFRVPIRFDGSTEATVTVDRQRLTLAIRPLRRRTAIELPLQQLAEQFLFKAAKLRAQERIKAKRAKRLARRQS